jgi:Fe-S-cluster containining protein
MTDFVQITRRSKIPEEEFYPAIKRMYEYIWQRLLPPQLITEGLSNTIKNNVVTSPDAPIPDCLTCGACCQSFLCVGVRPSDDVDTDFCWDITVETSEGDIVVDRYLRRSEEMLACAAFEGNIGEKVACTIYETRPAMCRDFEAGSDRCHALRRAYGIEPFLSLNEMSEATAKLKNQPTLSNPSEIIRNAQIRPDANTGQYVITALMKDGALREIHRYDAAKETWMQFEFDGLKLPDAEALIESRQKMWKPA